MRSEDGTYALLLRVPAQGGLGSREVRVGALGMLPLRAGVYVYIGRAFGPGGLRARVGRHARGEGAQHWHVDYLRPHARLEAVWYTYDTQSRECAWATVLLNDLQASLPMNGFGASDCECSAHLAFYERQPSFDRFRDRVRARCPGHAEIKQTDGASLADG